ncbi:MAG: TIGR02453 family protein [Rhodoglobus sp.]
MSFTGIPLAAAEFFAELEAHNTKTWWSDNKDRYERDVRQPFIGLLDKLDSSYQPWRVYRPHRDTRFAVDKSPYKNFIGAVAQSPKGEGYFLRIDKRGLLIGSGYPMLAPDQLNRLRNSIDDDILGAAFIAAIAAAESAGIRVTGGRHKPLTTAPRGYRRDHPRITWLRAKGVEIPNRVGQPEWLHGTTAPERVATKLRNGAELIEWLNRNVGPSKLSPEEIWGR